MSRHRSEELMKKCPRCKIEMKPLYTAKGGFRGVYCPKCGRRSWRRSGSRPGRRSKSRR